MTEYKHTQIGFPMLVVTAVVLILFVWMYITTSAEPPSYNSGTNFAITTVMIIVLSILSSFITLTVSINQNYLRLKFGFGIYQKKFLLDQITSAKVVRNHWYYGWGIHVWFWPYMWIYNVSGFDAVEIVMKNGKIYRIGTDDPKGLENILNQKITED